VGTEQVAEWPRGIATAVPHPFYAAAGAGRRIRCQHDSRLRATSLRTALVRDSQIVENAVRPSFVWSTTA